MTPAELRDQLQAALADRYVIERELGRGGMATVYLARDLRHERLVALKVLRPDLGAALGAERFTREIKLAAGLQHPHIVSIHDSGSTPSGQLWFTMPYVEGESLRDRVRRQRQLSLDEALRIAREVALALDYAHRHGVVHRDIKPENILLVDGQAMVSDFGVARALAGSKPGDTLTQTGMAIGTPAYMSPEQAAGERAVENASDVYSLGVVLYEMLAGEPPYTGPTAQAIAAKMMAGEPPSVRRTRSSVPPAVDQAIHKALSPVPADRYSTAAEFARALETGQTAAIASAHDAQQGQRRVLYASLAAAAVVALLIGVAYVRHSRAGTATTASTPGGPVRLAVLPFDNLGDSSDAYFADGLTDAVRTKLTTVPGVEVIASNSSAQYRHTAKSPRQIGQELGVRYLLVGKVRWAKSPGSPGRLQVTPELIEAESAADKWSAPYDTTLTDVFRVQGAIATQVAQALGLALTSEARAKLDAQPTQNLAAYDAFLRGDVFREQALIDPVLANRAAIEYERAVTLDSNFALAWAQLAIARTVEYFIKGQLDPGEAEEARRASVRATALAPDLPTAWAAKSTYDDLVLNDHNQATKDLRMALRLAPNDPMLLRFEGDDEEYVGHWETAETHYREAQRLDPRSAPGAQRVADLHYRLRRFAEATIEADHALALEPRKLDAIGTLVDIAVAQGDLAGVRSIIRAAQRNVDSTALLAYMANTQDVWWALDSAQQQLVLRLTPAAFDADRASWAILLSEIYWLRGDSASMRAYADTCRLAVEPLLTPSRRQTYAHAEYALALAYLGRRDEAVREAQRARALEPDSSDLYSNDVLARVYVLAGQPDRALDILERRLKATTGETPQGLRIDPNFKQLRGNPRFERLIAQPTTGERPTA